MPDRTAAWPAPRPGSAASRIVDQGRTEGLARGRADGYTAGQAESMINGLFIVLAARRLHLPVRTGNRIVDCTDLDQLDPWLQRAATAESVEEIFG